MSKFHIFYNILGNHKYFVTSLFIILIVGFVDENSLWNRHKRNVEIASLRSEIDFYQNKYNEDSRALKALSRYENVLTIARQTYLMKRDDEDIYVFVQKELPDSI